MKYYIFGAKAIAFSVYKALRKLCPEDEIMGFLVSSRKGNPDVLSGMAVQDIFSESQRISQDEKKKIQILVATPEDIHKEIVQLLVEYGFSNYRLIDSKTEEELMERYYREREMFPALHDLPTGQEAAELSVYAAQFCKDRPLVHPPEFPDYVHTLLLGCGENKPGDSERKAEFYDNTGEHISLKNPDYCELTAFYWIWKNQLDKASEYVGVYHYRRCLNITETDRQRLKKNHVDVVLQFPMMHAPDIREHHTRYVEEKDWELMLSALREIHPDYAAKYEEIFSGPYFYNYNLIIARKQVFADYCEWLFPVLFRTEELSISEGRKHGDRYLAYMSESLFTLYFLYHQKDLKIYHAARRLFV